MALRPSTVAVLRDQPESVRAAAQKTVSLLRKGWVQGEMNTMARDDDSNGELVSCFCFLGALRQAIQGGYVFGGPDTPLFQAMSEDLYVYLRRVDPDFRLDYAELTKHDSQYGVTLWNDDRLRTKAGVIARAEKWAKRFR